MCDRCGVTDHQLREARAILQGAVEGDKARASATLATYQQFHALNFTTDIGKARPNIPNPARGRRA